MTSARIASAAVLLSWLLAGTAMAEDPKKIGSFEAWTAYTNGTGKELTCYMVAMPDKADLVDRRGDIYVLIYHRPEEKETDVVQVDIGYTFKTGSEAQLAVDGKSWKLFTKEGTAWANNADDDKAIVAAMRKGTRLTVKGSSSRGNDTTDQYSLKGVTKASEAIAKACKVKFP